MDFDNFKKYMRVLEAKFYWALSSKVFNNPAMVPPPDLRAEITFLAGDCSNPIISPISSFLDVYKRQAC